MGIVREAVRPIGSWREPPLSVRVVSPLNKVIFRRVRIAAIATAAASTSPTAAESALRVWSGEGGTDGDSIICQIVGQRERHFAEWSNGIYLA